MPMRRPVPWIVKQWAIAAGNAPNENFNGPETHAYIIDNEKLKKQKQQFIYFKRICFFQIFCLNFGTLVIASNHHGCDL